MHAQTSAKNRPVPSPTELSRVLSVALPDGRRKCRLCDAIPKSSSSGGHTNFANHLRTKKHVHEYISAYYEYRESTVSVKTFGDVVVDESARNAHRWLDWIVHEHRELSFCAKPRVRKYSTLTPICEKTFKRYLHAVEVDVRCRIKERLTDERFGLMFDAWTEAGTHYVAVIGITPSPADETKADKFLLCFTPFRDETKQDADAFIELFDFVLERYALDMKNLCFVVCDHASVNGAFARKAQVPMIGCASHRLQLAVGKILEPHDRLIKKVHELMVRLDNVKRRAWLEDIDAPMPLIRNTTRWSSTFEMVKRYFEIHPFLEADDAGLVDVLLTARQHLQLKLLLEDLEKLESVSKRLQEDPREPDVVDEGDAEPKRKAAGKKKHKPTPTLSNIRSMFDGIIKTFPAARTHLVATPKDGNGKTVLKSPEFETGIVKVLRGKEEELTDAEADALVRLLRPDVGNDGDEAEERSFADQHEDDQEEKKRSAYIALNWIPGTSNEVERLFSRAGIVLTERRYSLYPATLEKLLMLEYNDRMWDMYTVADALRNAAAVRAEARKKQRSQ